MAELGGTPKNLNHLREKNFISQLSVAKLPNIDFFLTGLTMPGFNIGETIQAGLNKLIPHPGNSLQKDPLTIQFIIDEDLTNWLEIYKWFLGMTFPESFEESCNWIMEQNEAVGSVNAYKSTLQVIALKNSMFQNVRFNFHNAFPTNLDGFDFTVSGSDEPIVASATFTYSHMTFERL